MSVIAPAAPLFGHGPISNGRSGSSTSGGVAAHELADPKAALTAQLTFKGLLQSENVQTIQENLATLARLADHLPRDLSAPTDGVGQDELLIMGKLVRDISSSLDKIGSLREEEDEALPGVADKYVPVRAMSSAARKRRREKMKVKRVAHKCHSCNRLETPQWRPGPDGPKTLCNVCGLIYTKRQQRHAEQLMRAPRDE